jgi:hypothetical protein
MKTLVVQSFRSSDIPAWIGRCLASVRAWARSHDYDYLLTDDSAFELCGKEYLAQVGANMRSITNLCRLELIRRAHAQGYQRAVWLDADVFVFDPDAFSIDGVRRYAFARETWLEPRSGQRWRAFSAVNNCTFVCLRGEPDLEFLIHATRHIARHRTIKSNYQVGGDLIKGLRNSLAFEMLDNVAMLSNFAVLALVAGNTTLLQAQARFHGTPVHAANLCASDNYKPPVSERQALVAIDVLESTRGAVINNWLDPAGQGRLALGTETEFQGPEWTMLIG